jgi:hypothetical protein
MSLRPSPENPGEVSVRYAKGRPDIRYQLEPNIAQVPSLKD